MDVLGLQPGCSAEDVKSAFRKVALSCHPDRLAATASAGERAAAAARFSRAVTAYEALLASPAERRGARHGGPTSGFRPRPAAGWTAPGSSFRERASAYGASGGGEYAWANVDMAGRPVNRGGPSASAFYASSRGAPAAPLSKAAAGMLAGGCVLLMLLAEMTPLGSSSGSSAASPRQQSYLSTHPAPDRLSKAAAEAFGLPYRPPRMAPPLAAPPQQQPQLQPQAQVPPPSHGRGAELAAWTERHAVGTLRAAEEAEAAAGRAAAAAQRAAAAAQRARGAAQRAAAASAAASAPPSDSPSASAAAPSLHHVTPGGVAAAAAEAAAAGARAARAEADARYASASALRCASLERELTSSRSFYSRLTHAPAVAVVRAGPRPPLRSSESGGGGAHESSRDAEHEEAMAILRAGPRTEEAPDIVYGTAGSAPGSGFGERRRDWRPAPAVPAGGAHRASAAA